MRRALRGPCPRAARARQGACAGSGAGVSPRGALGSLLLATLLAACGVESHSAPPGQPPPEPPELRLHFLDRNGIERASIQAEHTLVVDPCRQVLGTVRADNLGLVPASASLLTSQPGPISVVAASGEVPAGSSVEFSVVFDCDPVGGELPPGVYSTSVKADLFTTTEGIHRSYPISVVVVSGPPTVAPGCADPRDRELVASGDPSPGRVTLDAAFTCNGGWDEHRPGLAACVAEAVLAETQLSASCADCFGSFAACFVSLCGQTCGAGPAECAACADSTGCNDIFWNCSHLERFDPCEGLSCPGVALASCLDPQTVVRSLTTGCAVEVTSAACADPVDIETTCAPESPCVDGFCKADPSAYTFSPDVAYVSHAQVAPADCCFDLDGDGETDNALTAFEAWRADYLPDDLRSSIDTDEHVELLEFRDELSTLNLFPGRLQSNGSSAAAGFRVFEVPVAAFAADNGAPRDSALFLQTGTLVRTLATDSASRLAIEVRRDFTASGAISLSGGRAGGLLPLEAYADFLDAQVHVCDCFVLAEDAPAVVTDASDPQSLRLACSAAFAGAKSLCATGAASTTCVQLGLHRSEFCQGLGTLRADQDSDGDGQNDAISAGVLFRGVAATISGTFSDSPSPQADDRAQP
ncbi:MAG: hypothetical protein H6744_00125 [Deltaproteobacteria bacterium]|nr:hypothetical protein [Deltaproteobacteria bacterium]